MCVINGSLEDMIQQMFKALDEASPDDKEEKVSLIEDPSLE